MYRSINREGLSRDVAAGGRVDHATVPHGRCLVAEQVGCDWLNGLVWSGSLRRIMFNFA
jgi:hypothetical protein